MRGRKRWLWVVLGFLFGCPCLLTGIALTVLKLDFASTGNTLPNELAKAKAAGIATDPGELRALIAIPEEDNAAAAYEAAIAAFDAEQPKGYPSDALTHFQTLTSTPLEEIEVRDYLNQMRKSTLLFEKAAAKKSVDWHRRWEAGSNLVFPEFPAMKNAAKLLSANAIVAAKEGHIAEAFRLLTLGNRIGMHAGKDPTLIGWLVQIAIDSIVSASATSVLKIDHSPAAIELARQMVRSQAPMPPLTMAFAGETVMLRIGIQNIVQLANDTASTDAPMYTGFPESVLIRDPGFRKGMEAKSVRNLTLTYLAAKRATSWKNMKAEIDGATATIDADKSLENRLATDFLFSNVSDAGARALAYRNILAAGIEILAVRQKTGHLPASLPSLGEIGIDPFTDKPFGYRITADGFKVYSVGSDLVDDGGLSAAEDRKGKSKTHDLVRDFK